MTISTLFASQCSLGESPLWHQARGSCFWVDIHNSILYEYNLQSSLSKKWTIPHHVSLVTEDADEQLILAIKGGVIRFDPETGDSEQLAILDQNSLTNRCNDGACDVNGRLWVGTMNMQCNGNVGSLYRVDNKLQVKQMISGLTIPNGLVWSLQNNRMYFIDTPTRTIVSYLFNTESGDISYEKVAITIPDDLGMPDGMTIDAEGMLWVAIYHGGCITRWNPATGQLLDKVMMPALNITNCAFVGEDLDNMIVTSARENLSAAQLEEYPESGNVFIIKNMPVKGVKANKAKLILN